MPLMIENLGQSAIVMAASFFIGTFAQYLRQKVDPDLENKKIFWNSLASGFSASIAIGVVYEKTNLSPSFLEAIAGLVGWAGVDLLNGLASSTKDVILDVMRKQLGIRESPTTYTDESTDSGLTTPSPREEEDVTTTDN